MSPLGQESFQTFGKKTLVKPIFKSGNAADASNYRPISLVPVMSKILEKIVSEQLTKYLQTFNYFNPQQYGFRQNYATETAICALLENIVHPLDKGNMVGAVFLDLKRAFDTVNYQLLLSKLSSFNFSKQALQWFDSYLHGREQCVMIKNVKSAPSKIKTGIPQGTTLGPILFCLYVNDLPEVCPEVGLQMYADDTVVYMAGKTPAVIGAK